ncbi:MAG: hypothetical protein HFG34_01320 [Eubacterium sp.]|nr:hypothetical protein [Eubacterium sp.]
MSMLKDIYDSRGNGRAVQVISECFILPEGTEAVCYQEMSGDYLVYVLEKQQFHQKYSKRDERRDEILEIARRNTGEKLQKEPKGKEIEEDRRKDGWEESQEDLQMSGLIRFLDADTYREKIKILEVMKDRLDDHMLNNMAVSLDLSLEDGVDGYAYIMSELKIRSRFEGKRGERL